MGAWGLGNFENDDALDWVYELEGSEDLSAVLDAFKAINLGEPAPDMSSAYNDATECSRALAAAEVIAALRGHPHPDLPTEVAAWVGAHGHLALNETVLAEAHAAISAVLKRSELQELWEETEEYEDWREVVADLRRRF